MTLIPWSRVPSEADSRSVFHVNQTFITALLLRNRVNICEYPVRIYCAWNVLLLGNWPLWDIDNWHTGLQNITEESTLETTTEGTLSVCYEKRHIFKLQLWILRDFVFVFKCVYGTTDSANKRHYWIHDDKVRVTDLFFVYLTLFSARKL